MMTLSKFNLFVVAAIILLAKSTCVLANPDTLRNLITEEQNRLVVLKFYDAFFNRHQVDEAAKVIVDDYKQHNPHVPDGKVAFVSYFTDFFNRNPQAHTTVVRSATDGDLVYLHVHSTRTPNDPGTAGVDIFRVKDGRIVEHWDVNQAVPQQSANVNTMF